MKQENVISNYRYAPWLSTDTNIIIHGIDVKVNGKWFHLKPDDNDPLFMGSKKDAMAKVRELKSTLAISSITK